MTNDDPILDDLLDRWEAAREAGRSETPEELCRDRPELLERVRECVARLELFERRMGQASDLGLEPPQGEFATSAPDLGDSSRGRAQSARDLPPSRVIGNYRLLEKLGEGGMGAVWLAEQERPLRRRVALKLIKAGVDNEQVVARFEAERQALAMMDHSNIARILDAGQSDDGRPYFVMELVQGVPLTKYCDQHQLSIRERLELFISVCKGVQHAHQKGIIHRDLKPSNVLVCLQEGKPVPKVIDFGLAKALEHTTHLTDKTLFTEFGQVVGTVQYMSPEQAEVNQLDIDTRTDIYSLGVMLYELLTGSTPIDAQTLREHAILKVLAAIREKEPPRPSLRLSSSTHEAVTLIAQQRKIDPSRLKHLLQGELDWVVMKALEIDRTRRYETAVAFADDLSNYLAGNVVVAKPPSPFYLAQKYVLRHKQLVGALTAIMLLLTAGIVSTSWFALEAHHARDAASESARTAIDSQKKEQAARVAEAEQRVVAEQQRNLATDAANTARRKLMELFCEKGDVLLDQDERSHAMLWYAGALELAEACDVPQETHRERLASILQNSPRPRWVEAVQERVVGVRMHASGRWAAFATVAGKLHLVDVARRAQVCPPIAMSGGMTCLDVHHDEAHVLVGCSDGTIAVYEMSSGTQVMSKTLHVGGVGFVTYTHDGRHVLSGGADRTCRLWDRRTAADAIRPLEHQGMVRLGQVSQDGSTIITGTADGLVYLWNAKTGEKIGTPLTQPEGRVLRSVALSADGSRAITAAGRGAGSVRFWDRDSGKPVFNVPNADEVTAVAFLHPSGTSVFTTVGPCNIWDISTMKVHAEFKLAKGSYVAKVEFNQDGTVAALANGKVIHLRDTSQGRKICPDLSHESEVAHVDVSGDGRYVVSSTAGGVVRIWDLAFGVPTQMLMDEAGVNAITFDNAGRRLLSGGESGLVSVWELPAGKLATSQLRHAAAIRSIACSPDGQRIGVLCDDYSVTLWDASTFEKVAEFVEGTALVPRGRDPEYSQDCTLQFTRDGKQLLGMLHNGHLLLWDLESRSLIREFDPGYQVVSSHLSPDETKVATCSMVQRTVHLWDLKSGELLKQWSNAEMGRYRWVRFSPRGDWLVLNTMESELMVGGTSVIPLVPDDPMVESVSTRYFIPQIDFVADGVFVKVQAQGPGVRYWGPSDQARTSRVLKQSPGARQSNSVLSHMADDFMVEVVSKDLVTGNHLHPLLTTPGMPAFHRVASTPNGRQLALAARWMSYIEYRDTSVNSDGRPSSYWRASAELLAGRRIAEDGSVVHLTAAEIEERWRTVITTHESEWLANSAQVWNWHHGLWSLNRFTIKRDNRTQAKILAQLRPGSLAYEYQLGVELRRGQETDAALEQLKRVSALAPGYTLPLIAQAEVHAMSQRWAEAAAEYKTALDMRADGYLGVDAGNVILCCLAANDHERLNDALRKYWEKRKRLTQPGATNSLVWFCCLAEQKVIAATELVSLAEKVVSLAPRESAYHNTLGLALYRAGDDLKARSVLQTANAMGGESFHNCAVLAMCCARLKEFESARQWLDKAAAMASTDDTPWQSQPDLSSRWKTLVTERVLLDQARTAVESLRP